MKALIHHDHHREFEEALEFDFQGPALAADPDTGVVAEAPECAPRKLDDERLHWRAPL